VNSVPSAMPDPREFQLRLQGLQLGDVVVAARAEQRLALLHPVAGLEVDLLDYAAELRR
jgi:hypothetical protein